MVDSQTRREPRPRGGPRPHRPSSRVQHQSSPPLRSQACAAYLPRALHAPDENTPRSTRVARTLRSEDGRYIDQRVAERPLDRSAEYTLRRSRSATPEVTLPADSVFCAMP